MVPKFQMMHLGIRNLFYKMTSEILLKSIWCEIGSESERANYKIYSN